jgi:hypothetical protein
MKRKRMWTRRAKRRCVSTPLAFVSRALCLPPPLFFYLLAPLSSTAEMTALPKVDTNCTAPSLIPTVNGNTVRSFSTHGQQSTSKGSLTTVSRSDIRLIQYLDSSALGLVRRWLLIGYFPIHLLPLSSSTNPGTREHMALHCTTIDTHSTHDTSPLGV